MKYDRGTGQYSLSRKCVHNILHLIAAQVTMTVRIDETYKPRHIKRPCLGFVVPAQSELSFALALGSSLGYLEKEYEDYPDPNPYPVIANLIPDAYQDSMGLSDVILYFPRIRVYGG